MQNSKERITYIAEDKTRGLAVAEGPRDAFCQLKSSQLLHSCTKNRSCKRLATGERAWRWDPTKSRPEPYGRCPEPSGCLPGTVRTLSGSVVAIRCYTFCNL